MLQLWIELQNRLPGRRDERGASAVEYGLMLGLIAAIIVVTSARWAAGSTRRSKR